ncbi:MAG: 4-hydroxy-tetrahydrodipicolinate synthase [Hyphomonadaceae bacterium]
MFHGSLPALITPFRAGNVDEAALAAMVERQIAAGTHGLVPCGTTGESVTLTQAEHQRVVRICVEAAAGRVPIMAGAGSNATERAITLVSAVKSAGAKAALVVAPYYNRPSQEGLYQHFKAVHDATDLPIYLYNVPGRTIVDLSVETVARLAALPRIVGIKDATGDLGRVARHRLACGGDFIQLSGDDPNAIGFNAYGGLGCISVTANVAPDLCAQVQNACAGSDYAAARAIDDRLAPLHKALFVEPSPAPAKFACSLLGLCTDEVRLPIVPCSEGAKAQVRDAMKHAGLL